MVEAYGPKVAIKSTGRHGLYTAGGENGHWSATLDPTSPPAILLPANMRSIHSPDFEVIKKAAQGSLTKSLFILGYSSSSSKMENICESINANIDIFFSGRAKRKTLGF